MNTKRCSKCGEYYSTTYKKCPFCGYSPQHRGGGKRLKQSKMRIWLKILVLMLAIGLASLLIYSIFKSFQENAPASVTPTPPVVTSPTPTVGPSEQPDEDGAVPPDVSDIGSAPDGTRPTTSPESTTQPHVPAGGTPLILEKTDISLFTVGETAQLKLMSAPEGTVKWESADESVATVSDSGKVTAVGAGKANVTATAGGSTATCIVRVRITTITEEVPADTREASLNKTDITFFSASETYGLKVTGITTAITWKSDNPGVATVDKNGKVTAVANGTANITASYDGITLKCIVRVKT